MASLLTRVLKSKPRKTVVFREDPGGGFTHRGEESWPAVFSLDIEYVTPTEMAEIQNSAARRMMTNPKKRQKSLVPDAKSLMRTVGVKAVKGWDMTVGACRRLELIADLSGLKADEKITFSADELSMLIENSNLGSYILLIEEDYDFWFPGEKEEEKNSESGPSGNTSSPSAVAPTASTAT